MNDEDDDSMGSDEQDTSGSSDDKEDSGTDDNEEEEEEEEEEDSSNESHQTKSKRKSSESKMTKPGQQADGTFKRAHKPNPFKAAIEKREAEKKAIQEAREVSHQYFTSIGKHISCPYPCTQLISCDLTLLMHLV
jgi:hypothetical protein